MSDDKKLHLPAVNKTGVTKSVSKKPIKPPNLSKKSKLSEALGDRKTVQEEIARRESGLDLVLVGDLTGSMGEYHTLLKEKFVEISKELFLQIKNLRIGIIFYLDHGSGDPYVTTVLPFEKNPQKIGDFINETATGCGGDEDEAVEDAFHDVVNMGWRQIGSRSVVLFGDARAHEPESCPHQYSYFDLVKRMYTDKIVVNSVYCGGKICSDEGLQKLEDTDVGDFSERVSCLDHPNFFSWVANVTGGMIIGVEQIDDLIEIIKAAAAKDSGGLDKYEENLKLRDPKKLNLVKIAKRADTRRITAEKQNLLGNKP